MSPEGSKEFALSLKSRNTALVLLGGALVCAVTSAIVYNSNKDLARGLLAGSLGFDVISIPFSIRSAKKLQHAIWLRNRDVVFGGK